MWSGVLRAEGTLVTSSNATDQIVIQQKNTDGTWSPKQITVANLLTGGGTGLTANSVPFVNASGDFTQDNSHFNYVAGSTHVLTATTIANTTFNGATVNAGASGTVGAVTVYPSTAANGSLKLTCTGNSGNYQAVVTTISSLGQATTYTLPDPGAATANVVLSAGTQTLGGAYTFSAVPIGTQYVVQIYVPTITALAGQVTTLHSCMFSGTVTKISASVNAAFSTSNIVITPSIYSSGSGTAITSGAVTITQSGSGAGTTSTATPSAANTFVAGNAILATITGGTGTCNGVIAMLITRTA